MFDCNGTIAYRFVLLVHPHVCVGSAESPANGPQLGSDGPARVGAAPVRALPDALDDPAKPVSAVWFRRGVAGVPPVVPAGSVGAVASRSRAAALALEDCPKLVRAAGMPVRAPLFAPDAPASSVGAAVLAPENLANCKGLAARAAVPALEGFAKLVGADAKAFVRSALLEPWIPSQLSVKVFAEASAVVRAAPAPPALVRAALKAPAQSCHVVDQLLALQVVDKPMRLIFVP